MKERQNVRKKDRMLERKFKRTVGGMLMVEIFSIAKSFPLTKLFYLEKISMAKSLHIMNLSAVGDKMT